MKFALSPLSQAVAVAALICTAGAAQAAITASTSLSGFTTAAGGVVSKDSFSDLTINTSLNTLTVARAAGTLGYSLTSSNLSTDPVNAPSGLFVVPAAGNIAMSTTWFQDSFTIGNFSAPVNAVGANVFGTNVLGELSALGLTLTATDVNGLSFTTTSAGNSLGGFVGFVSDAPLASVVIRATTPNSNAYVSLDNVTLAAAPVPEPGSWMLMLAGGATVLRLAKRRRA